MQDNILTTDLTNSISPELLRSEIDDRVVKIRPSSTPLDQISRMIGARRAGSMKVDYYSVDTKAGSSKLVESTRDSSASKGVPMTFTVENGAIFTKTETVLMPFLKITDGQFKGQQLVGYVTESSDNSVTVIPVNVNAEGSTSLENNSASDSNAAVIRMGRAARELDVQTEQYIALPKKNFNFCQIFKCQIEESFYQRLADKEVGWEFTDQEEVAVMDMRMGMEKSFLFGARARIEVDNSGDEVFLTGGIWNQTDNTFSLGNAPVSEQTLISISRQAFTGHAGSTRKILLAGSGLIEKLTQLTCNRIYPTEKQNVWGIDFHLITTKFGTLYVHHSEVFDNCGKEMGGMVIDPLYITKYSHLPFSAERISFRKQGVRNTEGVVLTEASCLVLRHPRAHLRID